MVRDDSFIYVVYTRVNDLIDTSTWKMFHSIAKRENKMLRLVNQAKLRSYRNTPKYKLGFRIPMNYEQAMELDDKNRNTR